MMVLNSMPTESMLFGYDIGTKAKADLMLKRREKDHY